MSAFSSMFISHLIPYFALIWSLSYLLFFDKMLRIQNGERDIYKLIVPLATLGFAFLFIIIPVRTILNKCVDEVNINIDVNSTYSNSFDKFACDYDRENPVTKKEGMLKMLNAKMKRAENSD